MIVNRTPTPTIAARRVIVFFVTATASGCGWFVGNKGERGGRRISTLRVARGGALTRVAAGQIARGVGSTVATVGQPREVRRSRRDESGAAAAAQLAKVLGGMKGGATKVGQMLAMIDLSALPASYREPLQEELSDLLDSGPEVDFSVMRGEIEEGVGGSLRSVFAEINPRPIGSASIGQVYRATLIDGRDVAVKVKYPGVDRAVEADIKNLVAFVRFWRRALPIGETKELVAEVTGVLRNELDYEAEAANQRRIARLYADHPFIVVPDAVLESSGPNVLVTEWFDGGHSEQWGDLPQSEKSRLGEIIFRFYVGGIYRHHEFCADPHPGNVLLASDGRVGFVDFGAYKHMSGAEVEFEKAMWNAASAGDAEALYDLIVALGMVTEADSLGPEGCLEYALHAYGWQLGHGGGTAGADGAIVAMFNPRNDDFADFRRQDFPAAHLISRRVDLFTTTMLRTLGASADWHAIAREWMSDGDPATELGRLESEWIERRRRN